MKKTLKTILLLISVIALTGCSLSPVSEKKDEASPNIQSENKETNKKINKEDQEFNQSGQTKAIEDKTDLWQLYDNPEIGFSFQYPQNIIFLEKNEYNEDPERTYLKVELKEIGKKENPMDLEGAEEMENIEELAGGKFGLDTDFSLSSSKKVKSVGFLFAQDFLVLSRFEICNVTLERKLLFYFNNKQITITLYAPTNKLKETMPEYFTLNNENCGEEKIWNFEKQDEFYQTLANSNGSKEIQEWFDGFDKIAEKIIFAHR